MGNAIICVHFGQRKASYSVQVMRPDGKVEEFGHPVEVSEVMRLHPDHMVVQCCSLDRPVGPLSKIMIMRPDQELSPSQAYLIHPIPPQYRRTLFKSHLPKSPLGNGGVLTEHNSSSSGNSCFVTGPDGTKRKLKLKKLRGKRVLRLAAIRQLCATLLQPMQGASAPQGQAQGMARHSPTHSSQNGDSSPNHSNYSKLSYSSFSPGRREIVTEDSKAPLLDSRGSEAGMDPDQKPSLQRYLSDGWKPALDSIPESPVRFSKEGEPPVRSYHKLVSVHGS